MKTLFQKALLIGMIGLGTSTLKAQVVSNADHTANFNNYHTFAWTQPDIQVQNPIYNNSLITKNIENDVSKVLISKGLQINQQSPDLLFKFRTFTEKASNSSSSYSAGFPLIGYSRVGRMIVPYSMGFAGGYYFGPTSYTQGTLVIEAIDAKTNQLVWQGGVSSSITPKRIEKLIAKGVNKIMQKYPA